MSGLLDNKGKEIKGYCIFLTFPQGVDSAGNVHFAKVECLLDGCRFYAPVAKKCKIELMADKVLSGGIV